jgi:Tol biopolymer transport system component
MPTSLQPKLLLSVLLLAALLAFPVAAEATLTYVRDPIDSQVYVAEDDGSKARKIGPGRTPHVSPDGQWIAYLREGPKHVQELRLAPAAGGPARTLMVGWRESSLLAWSPDSQKILALRGPEIGKRKLVLIDVATGKQRVIARGYFSGFSFSPAGSEFVYARAGSEKYPPRSDVFRARISGGKPVAITRDHRSSNPLWGPGRIVLVKTVEGKKRRYGPKNELFLMNPQGKQVKRLTNTKVPPLLQGLFPTDWSADGTRLLAEFEGQDTSYAVTVDPKTGAQRPVAGRGESGFIGTALSVNGWYVLGYTGGLDPSSRHNVVAVPYEGGKPLVLAKNAFEPDWVAYEASTLPGRQ